MTINQKQLKDYLDIREAIDERIRTIVMIALPALIDRAFNPKLEYKGQFSVNFKQVGVKFHGDSDIEIMFPVEVLLVSMFEVEKIVDKTIQDLDDAIVRNNYLFLKLNL